MRNSITVWVHIGAFLDKNCMPYFLLGPIFTAAKSRQTKEDAREKRRNRKIWTC